MYIQIQKCYFVVKFYVNKGSDLIRKSMSRFGQVYQGPDSSYFTLNHNPAISNGICLRICISEKHSDWSVPGDILHPLGRI